MKRNGNKKQRINLLRLMALLAVVLIGFSWNHWLSPSAKLQQYVQVEGTDSVHYIDVEQGDAILVLDKEGHTMLIDAGENGLEDEVIGYLKHYGIKRIDVLIATHMHSDHIGGMKEVVETFEIGTFYKSQTSDRSQMFNNLMDVLKQKQIPVKLAFKGTKIPFGTRTFQVYYPNKNSEDLTDLNDNSIVGSLDLQGYRFLFTGDASTRGEKQFVTQLPKIDILKVAHHGSATSTSKLLLDKIKPTYGVISVGTVNQYGHPKPDTLERLTEKGTKIYRTDRDGNIIVTVLNKELKIYKSKEFE